jgi:hypothetical protein
MTNLTPKILAYANRNTTQVANNTLAPETAADVIADLIRAALEGDENFENLLEIVAD